MLPALAVDRVALEARGGFAEEHLPPARPAPAVEFLGPRKLDRLADARPWCRPTGGGRGGVEAARLRLSSSVATRLRRRSVYGLSSFDVSRTSTEDRFRRLRLELDHGPVVAVERSVDCARFAVAVERRRRAGDSNVTVDLLRRPLVVDLRARLHGRAEHVGRFELRLQRQLARLLHQPSRARRGRHCRR